MCRSRSVAPDSALGLRHPHHTQLAQIFRQRRLADLNPLPMQDIGQFFVRIDGFVVEQFANPCLTDLLVTHIHTIE